MKSLLLSPIQAITIYHLIVSSTANIMDHPNWKLLGNEICGNSNADRIIGGTNAGIGSYPWMARIGYVHQGYTKNAKQNYRCGGSLINKLYVVTAAHCVTNLPKRFKISGVRLGELDTRTDPDCEDSYCAEPVQDFKVRTVIAHKYYNYPVFRNDIALIRLDRAAKLNEFVMPICMIRGELLRKDYIGEMVEVAGWGVHDIENPTASDILQTVQLPVVEGLLCERGFTNFAQISHSQQLCVGGTIGKDSCAGDSGGPLMKVEALDGPPKYFLIGIVSFGPQRCGNSELPAIYTKVSSYVTWILDQIRK